MSFLETWLAAVDKKDSVFCVGIDPADFEMERGSKGLPKGTNKMDWTLKFVESVAPYAAAIKPNALYWKKPGSADEQIKGDLEILAEVSALAGSLGNLVVIEDCKYADIGDTNDAGIFYSSKRPVNAVTFSPFAGNMEEGVKQAHARGIGLIPMCLMSNPEYEQEKNKLVNITSKKDAYDSEDTIDFRNKLYTLQYVQLAHDAAEFGADAIVIGAPSEKNHITDYNISRARANAGANMLVLLPGVGHQGGEAGKIWKYFSPDHVIVNVGRALMFPKESDHATTAKHYQKMLNDLRKPA